MPATIGQKIVQFSGKAEGDKQIPAHAIINDVTDRAVKIKKYPLRVFFDRNFRIPDYQRGYQWEEENWGQLWEEIDKLFQADESSVETNITDVFFGSMFFAERDGDEVGEEDIEEIYDVIDGQQRLTTLSILFKILSDRLYECTDEEPDLYRTLGGEPTNIENLIYRNVGAGMEDRVSLIPNRHHRSFFEAMMSGEDQLLRFILSRERVHGNTKYNAIEIESFLNDFGIEPEAYLAAVDNETYYDDVDSRPNLTNNQLDAVKSEDDISKLDPQSSLARELLSNKVEMSDENQNFIEAYTYFENRLDNRLGEFSAEERAFAIINIKNYILHSFRVGYFEVQNDQPQLLMKIFEILNDRGMELKKADVMRTRIVACFQNDPGRDKYVDKWEEIVSMFGNDRIIEFLRTYFVVKGDAKARGELKDHLLEAFIRNPGDDSDPKLQSRLTSVDDAKEFLDDLTVYAKYYNHITDINNEGISLSEDGDVKIEIEADQIITRLRSADTSIWEPVVLGVYHDIVEEDISEQNQLVLLLRAVESMAIRKFAAMDTQTRDRAYAAAIKEFHENGLDGDLVGVLTDIEADDPRAVGEQLVESLYQSQWRQQWGKQVLRKIVSENFTEGKNQLVVRRLNLNDNIVHLEHIFPQTPVRSNADDKYAWFEWFFKTEADDDELTEMISGFIKNEDDDTLEEIAEQYQRDLGNLTLLHSEGNISIGNELFDTKARIYRSTKGFCELATSQYICEEILDNHFGAVNRYLKLETGKEDVEGGDEWDEVADKLNIDVSSADELMTEMTAEQETIREELEELREEWTYDTVTKNRTYLVKELCDLIAFSDDEFEDVDFEAISAEETKTKNDIITANYRRRLD